MKPITGRIGAEIEGIKLSSTLDQETVYKINHALVKYKVIFFKNQQHLNDDEQEGFAALLGTPLNPSNGSGKKWNRTCA
ncbi:TauD/TfdA dioxygenase family protein [Acinetobacter sp. TSRC1-2]|uniref:TauD/TfdA dioxygenase family protein n=1 Tax=unclassified Acinetobacter TaxID=196816 RepID=UPI003CE94C84